MKLETNKSGYIIYTNLDFTNPDIFYPNKSKKIQINLDKFGF